MEGRKALVLSTLTVVLTLFGIAVTGHLLRSPVSLSTGGQKFLSFGKSEAPIEVVLIEDFQCKNCRAFSKKVIPQLQEKYIQSGKVRFTLVPVSFLAGSSVVANAVLEIYRQNPEELFPYLKDLLEQEELKTSDLLHLAERRSGIDLETLKRCIEKGCHNQELDHYFHWAREVMGAQFRTPALYINGAIGSTYSFEAIQYQIEEILKKR